jgi:hypothetical protein
MVADNILTRTGTRSRIRPHVRMTVPDRFRMASSQLTTSSADYCISPLPRSSESPHVAENMERETGIEPATSSLGSWHSTAELLPLERDKNTKMDV